MSDTSFADHGRDKNGPGGRIIDMLPGETYRVSVCAGVDPRTGKQLMLTERELPLREILDALDPAAACPSRRRSRHD